MKIESQTDKFLSNFLFNYILFSFFPERPDPVRNCTLSNQSTDSLSFQCLEGFSGGLEQHFLLKVLASNGTVLRDNISSSTAAFSIRGLNPDSMFLLSVQAVNPKGRSDAVVSKVFTLRPPETQKNTEASKQYFYFTKTRFNTLKKLFAEFKSKVNLFSVK